ncbi:LacI family DNA-binding transcriptional regulator [Hymenobacter norwichensis]|uniref:LacI family DNA-binding transcriptional regulator n=1 Tax=Hymenobacter norwichensis TaxID=223903 RepID=UPI0003B37491|nr:LacI family DNA-binding transcriptional regulator [Hymenobacter norwichensis]
MASHRASMKDLAKALNLSVSTISRALSGNKQISEETRERVATLVKEMNFQPNRLASGLRKGRSGTLGVLVPHITGHFFPEAVHSISTEATKAGYRVMICESNEDEKQEKRNLELLLNSQVEGVLVSLANTTHDFRHFQAAQQQQVPLVFFDRVLEEPNISSVVLDDYQGAYQAVSHLIEQGCTRIAHITADPHLNVYRHRHRGYLAALTAHGITFDEQLVHLCDMSIAEGREAMHKLLALDTRPDAVFASKDTAAIGAMQVAKEHGLRIPDDLALATYSSEKLSMLVEPPLTSVDQQCAAVGKAAVRLLLDMMSEEVQPASARQIILMPSFIVRESSLQRGQ